MKMQAKIFALFLSLCCLVFSLIGCQSINERLGNYYELDTSESEVFANE